MDLLLIEYLEAYFAKEFYHAAVGHTGNMMTTSRVNNEQGDANVAMREGDDAGVLSYARRVALSSA
eukprot:2892230-Pyramimonas_sp.AAC.1